LKDLIALILLLAHVNFSMLIAQLDETDAYDQSGQQREDVNSIVEYLADALHIKHKPLKDSDDDNARYFHASKFDERNFEQLGVTTREYFLVQRVKFSIYPEALTGQIYSEIQGPPPKG
jgi:hypothetical protein